MSYKKTEAPIKNLYYPEPGHQGVVQFYARDDGNFNIEVNFGSRQAGMETDRDSLVAMRDSIDAILDGDYVLPEGAITEFERILEQYPMSTNLSLQRLLRRKTPWST